MSEQRCETCRHFKAGKGGRGYRAMVQGMIASNGRWSPSIADLGVLRVEDKDGQCQLFPDGVAKWKTDVCGQWLEVKS